MQSISVNIGVPRIAVEILVGAIIVPIGVRRIIMGVRMGTILMRVRMGSVRMTPIQMFDVPVNIGMAPSRSGIIVGVGMSIRVIISVDGLVRMPRAILVGIGVIISVAITMTRIIMQIPMPHVPMSIPMIYMIPMSVSMETGNVRRGSGIAMSSLSIPLDIIMIV